jgi:hypothetical protein
MILVDTSGLLAAADPRQVQQAADQPFRLLPLDAPAGG